MRRHIRSRLLLSSLAACLAFCLAACKSRTLDAREAANALADEFSDLLDFDNASSEAGPPPASAPDGPQMGQFTAPLLVGAEEQLVDGRRIGYEYGQDFPVLFYSQSGLVDPDRVVGAIVWIRQANKDDEANSFLRIEPPDLWLPDGVDPSRWVMRLTARVRRLAALAQNLSPGLRGLTPREVPAGFVGMDGNAFHIHCALFSRLPDGTEKVGNYVIWNLSAYPGGAGDNKVPMCACQARFADNQLVESNIAPLGNCGPEIIAAFDQFSEENTPCSWWNSFIAGRNTNQDDLFGLASAPDYQEAAGVLYPAGSRFFLEDSELCMLELTGCGRDESECGSDTDCPSADHRCCSDLCRDVGISAAHCGGCDQPVGTGQGCQSGLPCPEDECEQVCTHEFECAGPEQLCCENRCADRLIDAEHCGRCGNACGPAESCQAGQCCPPGGCLPVCLIDSDCPVQGNLCCNSACIDPLADDNFCGDCLTSCTGVDVCTDGRCCPPGGCLVEVVLARWAFHLSAVGGPDLDATQLSPGVLATPFTSLDGFPNALPSGQDFWLTEQNWDRGTYLAVTITAAAGYTVRFTRLEFDQASSLLFDGPTDWQMTDELGSPIGAGPVSTEFPAFSHEVVDLAGQAPDRLSLRWTTSGALVPTVPWGIDNVIVYGTVEVN